MQTKTTAKDFFLHAGIIISLYAGVGFLLNLLFSIINTAFPRVTQYYSYTGSISFPVAALIILTPVFLTLSALVAKGEASDPAKREIWVKRWGTFLTMFGAGAIIVGDLITLLYYFLDGQDLTTGFLLKVLAVLVVAGALFGYYLSNLRNTLTASSRTVWRAGTILFVLVSIILGFTVIGSPRTQRLARYDEQKVSDLQSIQNELIHSWWSQKGSLPQNLDELRDPLSYFSLPTDTQTGESYGYEKLGDLSFKLCADFNRASDMSRGSSMRYYPDSQNENWQHDAGDVCFERTIDPDLYPVNRKFID